MANRRGPATCDVILAVHYKGEGGTVSTVYHTCARPPTPLHPDRHEARDGKRVVAWWRDGLKDLDLPAAGR